MDFSAWFEVFLDGHWYTKDARHNHPRIGRIVMGRGRDAAIVAISTAFGVANLARFEVVTQEGLLLPHLLDVKGRDDGSTWPIVARPATTALCAFATFEATSRIDVSRTSPGRGRGRLD
jgi:transglutaminase-like putative cysteine protease